MTKPPRLALNPVLHVTVAFVLGLAAMRLDRREPAMIVFLVSALYALINPVLIALQPGWWFNVLLSSCGMVALLFVLPPMGLLVHDLDSLGETRITLVLPPLLFIVMLALSGILHLILVRVRRKAIIGG